MPKPNFWWIDRWREFSEECQWSPEEQEFHFEATESQREMWEHALACARQSDWSHLDRIVGDNEGRSGRPEIIDGEEFVSVPALAPRSLWPELEAFFANPPARRRGKRPRVDEMVTSLIRRTFRVYTTEPMDVVGCNDRKIGTNPPMRPMKAYRELAKEHGLGWETVRDIVERRHTDADPNAPKGVVNGGTALAKALRRFNLACTSIPDPWNYEHPAEKK